MSIRLLIRPLRSTHSSSLLFSLPEHPPHDHNKSITLVNNEPNLLIAGRKPLLRSSSNKSLPTQSSTNLIQTQDNHLCMNESSFPIQCIPLARYRDLQTDSEFSHALRALANGYKLVTHQQHVRQFWVCFEGKGTSFKSINQVEQVLQLHHPECTARVLEFASHLSSCKQVMVIDPMRLFLWIGDQLRVSDPHIDTFLNIAIFPEQWDVFEAPEPLWTIRNRIMKDQSKRHANKLRSGSEIEHSTRVASIRQVIDQGIKQLAQTINRDTESTDPVIIIDHTGVFSASQYGLHVFNMLTSALNTHVLSQITKSRLIYNQTSPSAAIAEENFTVMQQEVEDAIGSIFMHTASNVAMIKLDPVPVHGHEPCKYTTEVFRIMWQKQYLAAKLSMFANPGPLNCGVPKSYVQFAVTTLTSVLGSNVLEASDLDLLATALMGLYYDSGSGDVNKELILSTACHLFGSWMRESSTQKRISNARESDCATALKLCNSDDLHHSKPAIFSSSPSTPVHPPIPCINPESITVTLDDVIGQETAKRALNALISLPLQFPDQFSKGVLAHASAVGVLLYGPPGTGKTMLAKAIAKTAGATFISVSPSDVQDKYVGESEKFIKRLFEFARLKSKCVVFLDEVDTLFSKRDFDITGWRRDILNEFCMQWDGMKSSRNVIVLGATNRPFDLDEAVIRRFSRRVLVDLPTKAEQRTLLEKLLASEKLATPALIDTDLLPNLTSYSASDIKNMCIAAAMNAVRENPAATRVLSVRHFQSAMKEVRPSVSNSAESVVKLRQFAATSEQPNRMLGFIS